MGTAPERPDWVPDTVEQKFDFNDDHCHVDTGGVEDALGEAVLAGAGVTGTELAQMSHWGVAELLDRLAGEHPERVEAAREHVCPGRDCECASFAYSCFVDNVKELLAWFAEADDIVGIGSDQTVQRDAVEGPAEWDDLTRLGAGRSFDAVAVELDFVAGTGEVSFGQYGGYSSLPLRRITGTRATVHNAWAAYVWCYEPDPFWTIADLSDHTLALLVGLHNGDVDVSEQLARSEEEVDADALDSYPALWAAVQAAGLHRLPADQQRLIGAVATTWNGTLAELLASVEAATGYDLAPAPALERAAA